MLSGMRLSNGTEIWRFTPSDEVQLPKLQVVSSSPATFAVGGHVVLPVKRGTLLAAPGGSCAPAGFWITREPAWV